MEKSCGNIQGASNLGNPARRGLSIEAKRHATTDQFNLSIRGCPRNYRLSIILNNNWRKYRAT